MYRLLSFCVISFAFKKRALTIPSFSICLISSPVSFHVSCLFALFNPEKSLSGSPALLPDCFFTFLSLSVYYKDTAKTK